MTFVITYLLARFNIVKKNIPILTSTIVGPDDVLRYIDAMSPTIPEIIPKILESIKRRFMLDARFFAEAAGTMRSDVTRIIPIILRLTVITIAMIKKSRYSKNRTLIPSTRAISRLNVI